jgi:hypothetical protein
LLEELTVIGVGSDISNGVWLSAAWDSGFWIEENNEKIITVQINLFITSLPLGII